MSNRNHNQNNSKPRKIKHPFKNQKRENLEKKDNQKLLLSILER